MGNKKKSDFKYKKIKLYIISRMKASKRQIKEEPNLQINNKSAYKNSFSAKK